MDIKREFAYKEYVQRENQILHAPYNPELAFYTCIKEGDVDKIKELCKEPLHQKEGLGELSKSRLQNLKYHFVVTAALAARYCIEGGLEMAKAFSISDFYIQKVDEITKEKEISDLHDIMCLDYTVRMKNLRKEKICSAPIAKSIDFILEHLHDRITVDELAAHTGLNPTYLSRLFKKETGQTISGYIIDKKLETAKNMLIYSDFSPSEIAAILAFPSQSYFTEVFRKKIGVTPGVYKKSHFRSTSFEG